MISCTTCTIKLVQFEYLGIPPDSVDESCLPVIRPNKTGRKENPMQSTAPKTE